MLDWVDLQTPKEASRFLLYNSNAFRIRFILSQKWLANKDVLIHISSLFGFGPNYVVPHSVPDVFELRINGVYNVTVIFSYFDQLPLQSHKLQSYLAFKDLYWRFMEQHHLDPVQRAEMTEQASMVNPRSKGRFGKNKKSATL
jgi:hypothetical protein